MSGTYPPAPAAGTSFFPAFVINGYTGAPGTAGAVLSNTAAQSYFSAYKACTIYMMSFAILASNSQTATVSVQPYGAAAGGNGNFAGTAKSVTVPTSGAFVAYTQAQAISMSVGGYMGIAITVTAGTATTNLWFNGILWASQAGQ